MRAGALCQCHLEAEANAACKLCREMIVSYQAVSIRKGGEEGGKIQQDVYAV